MRVVTGANERVELIMYFELCIGMDKFLKYQKVSISGGFVSKPNILHENSVTPLLSSASLSVGATENNYKSASLYYSGSKSDVIYG